MEPMGPKIRRQRRRLGLTLDELAARTGISKPYLSLIETERVPNPPSDGKLTKLEQTLGFKTGELLTQAHLQRTPRDVRAILGKLLARVGDPDTAAVTALLEPSPDPPKINGQTHRPAQAAPDPAAGDRPSRISNRKSQIPDSKSQTASFKPHAANLDALYLSGVLRQLVERNAGNVETIPTNAVPVINRVSAGYPKDFTDLDYPKGAADTYLSCPDVSDPDAFAARVHGDSMTPKYREGDIVIFSPRSPVKNGDDAFVRFADTGETTFKRVFYETDETGRGVIRLQPRNEKYPPRTVSTEKLSGVWRAMFKYQSVEEEE